MKKMISTTEALKVCESKKTIPVSLPSIIKWAKIYKIGIKIGGRWRIDEKLLLRMLEEGNVDEKEK